MDFIKGAYLKLLIILGVELLVIGIWFFFFKKDDVHETCDTVIENTLSKDSSRFDYLPDTTITPIIDEANVVLMEMLSKPPIIIQPQKPKEDTSWRLSQQEADALIEEEMRRYLEQGDTVEALRVAAQGMMIVSTKDKRQHQMIKSSKIQVIRYGKFIPNKPDTLIKSDTLNK